MNKSNKTEVEVELNTMFDNSTIFNKNEYNGKELNIIFIGEKELYS